MDNPDDTIAKSPERSTSTPQLNESERHRFVRDFIRQVEDDRFRCDHAITGWHLSDVQVWAIVAVLREQGIGP